MPSTWAPNDWIATDPITHTYLNNIGNSIRTWGYGLTAGTVTINANQNAIGSLGDVTFYTGKYIQQDAWTAVSVLSNSWVAFGSGYEPVAYHKDKQGRVWLRGTIKSGTNGVIFQLPVGYRPGWNAQRVGANCQIFIGTDGNVTVTATSNTQVSIHCCFSTLSAG